MEDENKTNTVTIENLEAPAVESVKGPSHDELKGAGWTQKDLDSAEKLGIIEKPAENKGAVISPSEPKGEDKKAPPQGVLPDFTFKTPEQEKAFTDAFGPGTPQRAMYFRMKNERQARQVAEAERDKVLLSQKLLEDRIAQLEATPKAELDENGNLVDPEDKPLTLKQLKEMQKQEAETKQRAEDELREQSNRVADSLKTQEEYAKSVYPDFDDTLKLAKDLMLNLDSMIPEKWKQEKAIKLIKELQVAAAYADKKGLDDYNAPMISYELGQMHPGYGKPISGEDGKPKDPSKANGSLTPDEMKRLEKNNLRRTSSASIPGGGGSRAISVDDITVKEILKMTREERDSFKKKYPEKMRHLLRG